MDRVTGKYIERSLMGLTYKAFVPKPLPPDPPLQMTPELYHLMEKANRALGRLDGITALLPDAYLFTYFYLRKEAVLSSQIEGTQSSLSELLLFESDHTPGVPIADTKQVSNYVRAMYHGLQNVTSSNGLPLSLRLIREMHTILVEDSRGQHDSPGEFRVVQNWVGGVHPQGALFVGPPSDKLNKCLDAFEKFLYGETPVLIKAALAHVQFETIHPFVDGNGRLGRLLITLLLCADGALSQPMLYLSLFFKANRQEYYARLQSVRETGNWEGWLCFMLRGVLETSENAVSAAKQALGLFDVNRRLIESLGRISSSMLRLHQLLQRKVVITVKMAVIELGLSEPTVGSCLKTLQELGIVREATGKSRNRVFFYDKYMKILDEGTHPIQSAAA